MQQIVDELASTIAQAATNRTPLCIRGGGSKDFYGGPIRGESLGVGAYRGIVDYEPSELVITARGGTPLAEIEQALHDRGQLLAFEPPHYADSVAATTGRATIGGCISAGLSGPRRPYAGAARDAVLGIRLLDGKANDLRFGGQVMKNVAGFDVARLLTGSLGTLGVILEVSLKVLPLPVAEATLRFEHSSAAAIALMNAWAGKPLPISATAFNDGQLHVRLSGASAAVSAAAKTLGGERIAVTQAKRFWQDIRDHTHAFFATPGPLWRLSLKSTAPPLELDGAELVEWGGALRWLATNADAADLRAAAAANGGYATLFRGGDKSVGVFHPLPPVLEKIHRNLKQTFDPSGVFNPGRLYRDW